MAVDGGGLYAGGAAAGIRAARTVSCGGDRNAPRENAVCADGKSRARVLRVGARRRRVLRRARFRTGGSISMGLFLPRLARCAPYRRYRAEAGRDAVLRRSLRRRRGRDRHSADGAVPLRRLYPQAAENVSESVLASARQRRCAVRRAPVAGKACVSIAAHGFHRHPRPCRRHVYEPRFLRGVPVHDAAAVRLRRVLFPQPRAGRRGSCCARSRSPLPGCPLRRAACSGGC